jgi:hypothetical protein
VHVGGQLMSPPLTEPPPETETVSKRVSVELAHDALTTRLPSITTVQATLVPAQAPPQPLKMFPSAGVWSSVSVEPVSTVQVQLVPGAEPQSISPPLTSPSPAKVTDSVLVVVGGPAKFAVTSCDVPLIGISHVLPTGALGQPFQLSNVQSAAAVAVSVTVALPEKARWQVVAPLPQLMPPGPLVTVPLPIAWTVTVVTASARPLALATPNASSESSNKAATEPTLLPIPTLQLTL